jgi:ubiquinone/menaquinone biosynthesis C-methylase UbiE
MFSMKLRINVGCGQTPTKGWLNFDNSLSLFLSRIPLLPKLFNNLGIINNRQYRFIRFARKNNIKYADATKRLPIKDGSVDVLYSSHMLEHLDRGEADKFVDEIYRVLRPGGIVRIAVPDIKKKIELYNKHGDADTFIEDTLLCAPRPKSLLTRIRFLLVGSRHHHWMYDGVSLSNLLKRHGLVDPEVLPAGKTNIKQCEALDLRERSNESIYIEAEKKTINNNIHKKNFC